MRRLVEPLVEVIMSLTMGFAVASIVLAYLGYDPIRVFTVMFSYGFSDALYLLQRSTPLIGTALAFAIPLYAGLFNIGGEGSLYLGALLALVASRLAPNPLTPLLAGAVGGAAIGWVIGFLRSRYGVNEVVSSIMVNWILYYTVLYLVTNILYDPSIPHQSLPLPPEARLPELGPIPVGFLAAVLAAYVAYFIVYETSLGYSLRVVGYSQETARYAGIDPRPVLTLSMVIGNAFAGIAGALLLQTVVPYIDSTMSGLFGLGFNGIGVALLGRLNPFGIILASLFVSGLIIGGEMVELLTGAPPEIVDLVIGVIVIGLALSYAYRMLMHTIRAWRVNVSGRAG